MQTMPGTMMPEQLAQLQQQQQPLIDALRANQSMAYDPNNSQGGGVQGVTNALGMSGNSGLTRGMDMADAMGRIIQSSPSSPAGVGVYDW